MTTQISIGRNIDGEPMTAHRWRQFQDDVKWLFERVDAEVRGTSISASWGTEESYSVIGALRWPIEANPNTSTLGTLRVLANVYEQDAIAVADSIRLVVR